MQAMKTKVIPRSKIFIIAAIVTFSGIYVV